MLYTILHFTDIQQNTKPATYIEFYRLSVFFGGIADCRYTVFKDSLCSRQGQPRGHCWSAVAAFAGQSFFGGIAIKFRCKNVAY